MSKIGQEKVLSETSLLVSETDAKGKIIYANDLFLEFSEYTLEEMIGKPHNIIRHPDMPKSAFKDMWSTIKAGGIWKGFVKNRTKNNNYYWVFATVFPFGQDHYLSVRKIATRQEIEKYENLYQKLRQEEK